MLTSVDARTFRHVLGHFCTGITVITAPADEGPVGFACQSFAALSLDPPLVLFCPSRTSRTWPLIERAGRFCVNVLAHHQEEVSTVFGRPGSAKFHGTPWHPSPGGAPILADVLAWLDCTVEACHEAGDHYIVIGRVTEVGEPADTRPLLFFRGGYTATELRAGHAAPVRDSGDTPLTWPREGDWI
ncbi:MAG TPA: flavin reductase family protein [Pseudonocardiaceae bacterium]